MQNLSRKELRLIAKNRNICGYRSAKKIFTGQQKKYS